MRGSLGRKLTRERLDRFVCSHATEALTLDVGAKVAPYVQRFPNRVGLDLVPAPAITVVGNVLGLPFRSGAFGCVLCTEVLEHLPEPQAAVDEMHRVLRPDGILVLTTRFLFPIHDSPRDYYRFTRYGLQHLLRRFEMLELREDANAVESLAVLVQRFGFQTELLGSRRLAVLAHIAACLMHRCSWVVTKQYGQSPRRREERNIMTTGYMLACRKLHASEQAVHPGSFSDRNRPSMAVDVEKPGRNGINSTRPPRPSTKSRPTTSSSA